MPLDNDNFDNDDFALALPNLRDHSFSGMCEIMQLATIYTIKVFELNSAIKLLSPLFF